MNYTGVGSRKTPPEILAVMTRLAEKLRAFTYVLRSGGAIGADQAFERGAGTRKNIFYAEDATPEAIAMASKFHPAWDRCSDYAKRLHGRNMMQVLGASLSEPSAFLICWTPDGAVKGSDCSIKTGGTATAIRAASAHGVPVYNMHRMEHLEMVTNYLEGR